MVELRGEAVVVDAKVARAARAVVMVNGTIVLGVWVDLFLGD